MLFAGFKSVPGDPIPQGFSVVRQDGFIWDFDAGAFAAAPPAGAAVRPVVLLQGADHQGVGQLWADIPAPAPDGRYVILYHEQPDGGDLTGRAEPVEVQQTGSFSFSFAVALAR